MPLLLELHWRSAQINLEGKRMNVPQTRNCPNAFGSFGAFASLIRFIQKAGGTEGHSLSGRPNLVIQTASLSWLGKTGFGFGSMGFVSRFLKSANERCQGLLGTQVPDMRSLTHKSVEPRGFADRVRVPSSRAEFFPG